MGPSVDQSQPRRENGSPPAQAQPPIRGQAQPPPFRAQGWQQAQAQRGQAMSTGFSSRGSDYDSGIASNSGAQSRGSQHGGAASSQEPMSMTPDMESGIGPSVSRIDSSALSRLGQNNMADNFDELLKQTGPSTSGSGGAFSQNDQLRAALPHIPKSKDQLLQENMLLRLAIPSCLTGANVN